MTGPEREDRFRPGRRNQIIDEHRNTVPMLEVRDLADDAPPPLRKAVRNANRHRFAPVLRGIVCGTGVVVGLMLVERRFSGIGQFGASNVVRFGIQVVLGPMMGAYLGAEQVRKNARRALAECLNRAVCASCGYSLASLARAEDGCTVCPECGAAWKLPEQRNEPRTQ